MRITEICKDNLRISPSSAPDASPGTGGRMEGDFYRVWQITSRVRKVIDSGLGLAGSL